MFIPLMPVAFTLQAQTTVVLNNWMVIVFKVYRREYKKCFGWIKAKKIEQDAFYAWNEKAREEKAKCDAGEISLQEFERWLRNS